MKIWQAWDSIVWIAKDAYRDTGEDKKALTNNFFDDAKDFIGDTWEFWKNVVSTGIELVTWKSDIYDNPFEYKVDNVEFSKEFIEESKHKYTTTDMLTWIGWALWKMAWDFIVWDQIEQNLKNNLSYKDFKEQLKIKQDAADSIFKNQQLSLDEEKYKELLEFDANARAQYVKIQWEYISDEDFNRFKWEYFSKLDWMTQMKLENLSNAYQADIGKMSIEKEKADKEISTYLEENIEWGSKLYEEYHQAQRIKAEQNEWTKAQTKNFMAASKTVRDAVDLRIQWMTNASTYVWLERQVEKITEMEAANREYLLTILWNDKLKGNTQLASQWKWIMDNERWLALNIFEATAQKRWKEWYKDMTELEFRKIIEAEEWKKLPKAQQDSIKLWERFKTSMSIASDRVDIQDKAFYNPTILMDYIGIMTWWMTKIVDESFDYQNEVPHYIQQQMRSLTYSETGMAKKAQSMLFYNMDAIVSIAWASKILWYWSKWLSATNKVLWWIAWTKLKPIKVWFDSISVVWGKTLWKTISTWKTLVVSQLYGAVADTVLDISMASGKTTELDQFNQITNTLFDWLAFIWLEWIKSWAKQSWNTVNRILYEFLNESETSAIDKLITIAKTNDQNITKWEATWIMNDLVSTFNTFTDKKMAEQVFKEEWGLHRFISDNVANMEKHDITALMTWSWIGIKPRVLWIDSSYSLKDLTSSLVWTLEKNQDLNRLDIKKQIFNKQIDNLIKPLEVGYGSKDEFWVAISRKYRNDPEYLKDLKWVKDILTEMKESKSVTEFQVAHNDLVQARAKMQANYSDTVKQHNYVITDNLWNDYNISINDLKELEWQTYKDLLRDWKMTIKKWEFDWVRWLKDLEAWDYTLKLSKQWMVEDSFTKFINQQDDFIDDWIIKNWDLITLVEVKKQLKNLLFWRWTTKTAWIKGTIEEQKELLTSFATLLNDISADFLWDGIVASKPSYINTSIDVNKETWFASKKQIMTMMQNNDSYFNISYWSFVGKENTKESAWQAIYMWFGKKTLENTEISKTLNRIDHLGKDATAGKIMGEFKNSLSKLKNKIFSLWFKDWRLDIKKWINQTASTISYWDISNLFFEWKVSKKEITAIVNRNLKWEDNKEIIDFIYNTTKDATEADAMILKPIIYNLIYQYSTNKELVKKWLSNLWKNIKFDDVFWAVILSKEIKDYIIENVVDKSMKSQTTNQALKDTVAKRWNEYRSNLELKLRSLEQDKLDIEANVWLSHWAYERAEAVREVDIAIWRIKAAIKFKWTEKSMMYETLFSFNNDFLSKKLDNFRDNLTVDQKKLSEIADLDAKIEVNMSTLGKVDKLSDKDKLFVSRILDEVKAGTISIDRLQKTIDDSTTQVAEVLERIRSIKEMQSKEPHVLKDLWTLNDYFKSQVTSADTLEFLLDNNPLRSKLTGFLSGADYKLEWVDEKILDHFEWTWDASSAYNFYNSNDKFKEFVDWLHIPEGMDEKDILAQVKINKAEISKLVNKLFKDEVINVWDTLVTKKLIDDMLDSEKLYKQFKSIKNKIETSKENWYINFKTHDESFPSKLTWELVEYKSMKVTKDTSVIDSVLQFKNMKKASMNIIRLHWLKADNIWRLKWKKWMFHSQMIWDTKLSEIEWSIESLKHFAKVFNGEATDIQKILDIFPWHEKYSFLSWIWDKDWLMHMYSMPDSMVVADWVSVKERKAMNIEYYKYEYSYANWYIKNNASIQSIETIQRNVWKVKSLKELQKKLDKYKDNIIYETDITKREASNVSTRNTFDWLKKAVRVLIKLPRYEPHRLLNKYRVDKKDKKWIIDILNKKDKDWNIIKEWIQISDIKWWETKTTTEEAFKKKILAKYSYLENDIEKLQIYLKDTYFNDLDDWTSWITNTLGKLRWEINWISKKEYESGRYRQVKDHFYWENKDWQRIMWKTLFNMAEISDAKWVIDSAVIIWESSLKLWKDWYEKQLKEWKVVNICINWKCEDMIEMPQADTSFFKDASSDAYDIWENVSVSDSIKSSLGADAVRHMNDEQMIQIEKLFKQLQNDLTRFNVDINSFSAIDKILNKIPYDFWKGYWTNSVIQSKLTSFTDELHMIINKPKSWGEAMFIKESSFLIKENEVIMHEDSIVVWKIRNEVSKWMYENKIYKELTSKEKEIVDKNLYSVGYRYPVPNSYNIWTYRVRLNTEFKEYKRIWNDSYAQMWTEQVVAHPESTYMKLQWDNDGDHIFFISSNSNFGKTLSMDTLNLPDTNWDKLPEKYWEILSKWYDNKFIVLEQVEAVKSNKPRTLLETRLANTEAKLMIWTVAATIRTLKSMMWPNANKLEFDMIASQTLQNTLDFWKTWLLTFDKIWYEKLLKAADVPDTIEIRKWIKEKSQAYRSIKMDAVNITQIVNNRNWYWDKAFDLIVWGKADLLNRIKANKPLMKLVHDANQIYSLPYFVNNLFPKWLQWDIFKGKVLKQVENFWYIQQKPKSWKVDYWKEFRDESLELLNAEKWNAHFDLARKQVINFVTANKKDKNNIAKEFFLNKGSDLFNEKKITSNQRRMLAAYWLINWESKIYNYLTNNEMIDFLTYWSSQFDEILKANDLKMQKVIKEWDPNKFIEDNLKDIELLKKDINEWELAWKVQREQAIINKQNEIATIQKEIDAEQYIVDDIKQKDVTIEESLNMNFKETYDMPYVKTELLDLWGQQANEILNWVWDSMAKSDKLIKLRVSSMFEKWMPDFLAIYNVIRDEVNQWLWKKANEAHVYHFSDSSWLPNWKSISYKLRKLWIRNYKDYFDWIQDSFIKNEWWKFVVRSEEEYLREIWKISISKKDSVKIFFNDNWWQAALKDKWLLDALKNYSENVAKSVAEEANRLQKTYWYDIYTPYFKKWGGLIRDVIEAKNSDGQFAMRVMWFDKNSFEDEITKRMKLTWSKVSEWHLKTMMDVLIWPESSVWLKILWALKTLHYTMSYALGSFLTTWNWLLTWFAQVTPNYVELKAYIRNNPEMFREAASAMREYNLLWWDSVLNQWTWLGADVSQWPIWTLFTKWLHAIEDKWIMIWWKEIPYTNKKEAFKFVDMVINNPLGAWDYPLEFTRKLVAVAKTMEAMWFKNSTDLNTRMALSWNQFSWTFRSQVSLEFANSGWWVTSASRIYRDTAFTHWNNYLGNTALWRVPINALGYLMWWSFHKAATTIEKTLAIPHWISQFVRWDTKAWVANIKDWLASWMMYWKTAIYTTWIMLKIQKYEEDPNKMLTWREFQDSFNNSVVSLDILLWRHVDNYDVAKKYWATSFGAATFTTTWIFDQMIRLYKQPKLAYDLYKRIDTITKTTDKTQAEAFFQALPEIAEDHWASYWRFSWLKAMEDAYKDQMISARTWLMLAGWFTEDEKIFNEWFRFKKFKSFTDKWFGITLVNSIWKIAQWESYSLWMRNMVDMKDELLKDENLNNLVHWWYLWEWEWNFDLWKIYWTSKEDLEMFRDLYKDLEKYSYRYENSDWSSEVVWKYWTLNVWASDNIFYKDRLEKALVKEWFDLEYLMSISDNTPMLLKKLAVLDMEHDIKAPLVITEIVKLDAARIQKSMKDEVWRTNEYGYDSLYDDQYDLSLRQAIINNQELLSLNNWFVSSVIDKYITVKQKDVLETFEWKFNESSYFTEKNAIQFIQRSQVISDNFMRSSSSVGKLNSRRVNLFSWMDDKNPQMMTDFVNNTLQAIDDLPIPKVNKLANQAAAITGLSKANYWLLADDKEFAKLSEDSQALLANWMYKVSDEVLDFDSTKYKNTINNMKTWYSSSWYNTYRPKTKWSSFGWARPNYSKQFEPMRKLMDWKQWLFKSNPSEFIASQYKETPWFNNMRFPIMKEYTTLLIQEMFKWFRSEWIVQGWVKTFDKNVKVTKLRTPKVKKLKVEKTTSKKRAPVKVQRGVLEEFPLAK